MKNINRVLLTLFILCFAVLTSGLLSPAAHAAEFTISATPNSLAGSGNITVNITVTNTSDLPMESIYVTNSSGTYNMSWMVIEPGDTGNITINPYHIDESLLGVGIPFIISWMEGDEYNTETLHLTVDRLEAPVTDAPPTDQPDITQSPTQDPDTELLRFNYSVDKRSAEQDAKVVFTYEITNISNQEVTGVTLSDTTIIGANPLINSITLLPGESRMETFVYTMGETSVTSAPIVTYNGVNGTKTITGEQITIERVTVQMDISVDMKETNADGTVFSITVANYGNKDITSLTIQDNMGTSITQNSSVKAGDTQTFEHIIPPDVTREVYFIVSGTLVTGESYTHTTEKYNVWAYIDPSLVNVDFAIDVVEHMNQSGYITLKFTANNMGSVNLTNLSVSEEALGVVGTLDDLPSGSTVTASYSLHVESSRNLNFVLTGHDEHGKPWTFETVLLADSFDTVEQPTSGLRTDIDVGTAISNVLVDILTVLGVVAGISGVALIVLAILEKRASNTSKPRGKDDNKD